MSNTITYASTLIQTGVVPISNGQATVQEISTLTFGAAGDVTQNVATKLSHVTGMKWVLTGTDPAAANMFTLFINQAIDSTTKNIVVASSVVPVKRALTDASGTLIAATVIITLEGY